MADSASNTAQSVLRNFIIFIICFSTLYPTLAYHVKHCERRVYELDSILAVKAGNT